MYGCIFLMESDFYIDRLIREILCFKCIGI